MPITRTAPININPKVDQILEIYDQGITYYEGAIMGLRFKIRMNKDHSAKTSNNDQSIHNLSLVSEKLHNSDRESMSGHIQRQVGNVIDREDAKMHIEDFLNDLINQ